MMNNHQDYAGRASTAAHTATPPGTQRELSLASSTLNPELPDRCRSTTGQLYLFSRPLPSFPFPHRGQQSVVEAQHATFQLFVYLGIYWLALTIQQMFPGHRFCVSSAGLALESAHVGWTLEEFGELGRLPCCQSVEPHLIRFKSVFLLYKLDYRFILQESPALSQPPGL